MTIGNNRGVRDVSVQDQTTPIVDLNFTLEIDTIVLLGSIAVNDISFGIQVLTTPLVGDVISLKDLDGLSFYQGGITSVTPISGDDYTVVVDTPVDAAFVVGDTAALETDDLAVNGSVTPVVFSISPIGLFAGVEWDIVRILASILGTGAMGDGLFGNLTALTNGIVIRIDNGITKNVFNAKTNGEIRDHAFDLMYADKPPAGQEGMSFRRTFGGQSKNGVVVRISSEAGDGLKCIIQDDLTSLVSFKMVAQGHTVERGG